jgi:hypothetical protein
VAELEGRRPHAAGRTGEVYLASLLGVQPTIPNSPYDILTPTNCRLEVKTSKLNLHKHADGSHWGWTKPLGGDGDKEYDQLILLAEPDPRHINHYAQPLIRYVMFDIPFLEVPKFLNGRRDIFLGSNPLRVFSPTTSGLYRDFQITEHEFVKKYEKPNHAGRSDTSP